MFMMVLSRTLDQDVGSTGVLILVVTLPGCRLVVYFHGPSMICRCLFLSVLFVQKPEELPPRQGTWTESWTRTCSQVEPFEVSEFWRTVDLLENLAVLTTLSCYQQEPEEFCWADAGHR